MSTGGEYAQNAGFGLAVGVRRHPSQRNPTTDLTVSAELKAILTAGGTRDLEGTTKFYRRRNGKGFGTTAFVKDKIMLLVETDQLWLITS